MTTNIYITIQIIMFARINLTVFSNKLLLPNLREAVHELVKPVAGVREGGVSVLPGCYIRNLQ